MSSIRRSLCSLVCVASSVAAACTPYAVHTSAQPVLRGEQTNDIIAVVVPRGARIDDSSNFAEHAHFEATLITSGADSTAPMMPYGGLLVPSFSMHGLTLGRRRN